MPINKLKIMMYFFFMIEKIKINKLEKNYDEI